MLTDKDNSILRSISAYEAYEHITGITDLGMRPAGSEGAAKTEKYFKEYCEKQGLETVMDEFEEMCFVPLKSSISVTSPENISIEGQPMMFCANTPDEGVTAEVIYAGTGKADEYGDQDAAGKIVLFDRDASFATDAFFNEVTEASKRGAVGAIMVNFQQWPFIGTLESGFFEKEKRIMPVEPKNLPAMCISSDDGTIIKHMIEKGGVKVNIKVDAIYDKLPHHNVRAFIPGTKEPEKKIIICGHLDSEGNYGSNDNASGLAIMLELARVLSKNPCEKTIEIMAIGCEEISSMGSHHYCKMHADELDSIVCALNVDMVGVGSDLVVITEGNWPDRDIPTPEWLYSAVKNAADELNYKVVYDKCPLGTSDEGRFLAAGVPAVFLWKPSDEHYHSMMDRPEFVDPNNLKVIAEITCLAAMRISAEK